MLPDTHSQVYQNLQQVLQSLKTDMEEPHIFKKGYRLEEVQQLLQQLMQLDGMVLPVTLRQQVQRYHTEIHKQLRLLSTDLLFLRAAQQSVTQAQRMQQICDRIDTLSKYCTHLIALA